MQSNHLKGLVETALPAIAAADAASLEELRVSLLGKNGNVTLLLKSLGGMDAEARKTAGAEINHAKTQITDALSARRAVLDSQALEQKLAAERIDVTQPPRPDSAGALHPLSRTQEELAAIFAAMGFAIAEGPDIESDWNNFSALNIPSHHPARAMMDTFYLTGGQVLRTHTSPVQIRTMLEWAKTEGLGESPAPIRIIVPGRTFRADHDATHSPMFHQCEGLVIGQGITLGHLKGCLIDFLRAYFGLP
ncbi:MAG: phenylalanine--tRNA ligase subunit alpha, partial [Rhodospirillales bacterium]|nr:phenylalanine--tRNA ligase subunit alpha [Rhodospirillales bacterium]